jgi:hypothetical protein
MNPTAYHVGVFICILGVVPAIDYHFIVGRIGFWISLPYARRHRIIDTTIKTKDVAIGNYIAGSGIWRRSNLKFFDGSIGPGHHWQREREGGECRFDEQDGRATAKSGYFHDISFLSFLADG